MRNNLGQDVALLAEGGYGKITAFNEREVANRLRLLVNYHLGFAPLAPVLEQITLELAAKAIEHDDDDGQHYRDLLFSSLARHITVETAGLRPDEDFITLLEAYPVNPKGLKTTALVVVSNSSTEKGFTMNENTENNTNVETKLFHPIHNESTSLVVGKSSNTLGQVLDVGHTVIYGSVDGSDKFVIAQSVPVTLKLDWILAHGLPKEDILPLTLLLGAYVVRGMGADRTNLMLSKEFLELIEKSDLDAGANWVNVAQQQAHAGADGTSSFNIPYYGLAQWALDKGYVLEGIEPFDIERLRQIEAIEEGRNLSIEVIPRDAEVDLPAWARSQPQSQFHFKLTGISRELKGMDGRVDLSTSIIKSDDGEVQLRSVDIDYTRDVGTIKLGKYLFALTVAAADALGKQIYEGEDFVIGLRGATDSTVEPLLEEKPYNENHRAMNPVWVTATLDYVRREGFALRPAA